jgi:hypothetical protein
MDTPSWSASIHADRSGEDMVASEAIGRFLQESTKDEIHRSADQLLRLARHFEQSGGRDRNRQAPFLVDNPRISR